MIPVASAEPSSVYVLMLVSLSSGSYGLSTRCIPVLAHCEAVAECIHSSLFPVAMKTVCFLCHSSTELQYSFAHACALVLQPFWVCCFDAASLQVSS